MSTYRFIALWVKDGRERRLTFRAENSAEAEKHASEVFAMDGGDEEYGIGLYRMVRHLDDETIDDLTTHHTLI